MRLFDTHAHYDDPAFDCDRDDIISSLPSYGIERVCDVGAGLATSRAALAIAQKYPFVYASAGIHPSECGELPEGWEKELADLLAEEKVRALGEIGLDYHYDGPSRELQKAVFRRQMELAHELKMPVILHSRDAVQDTLEIVRAFPSVRGVCHCFSGSRETALEYLKLGWMISFTGVLTFKNAKKALEACAAVPGDRIMLETDCPYMAPVPFRGSRCDSRMMFRTLEAAAGARGEDAEELAERCFKNGLGFYDID